MLTRGTITKSLRYAAVGLLSNIAGYALYLLVTWLGIGPKTAMTLLYIAGAAIGFLGNRQWAFKHRGSTVESAVRYGVAHLFGYGLNFLLLFCLADWLGYPHQLVQAFAIMVVAVCLFVAFNLFVFPNAASPSRNT